MVAISCPRHRICLLRMERSKEESKAEDVVTEQDQKILPQNPEQWLGRDSLLIFTELKIIVKSRNTSIFSAYVLLLGIQLKGTPWNMTEEVYFSNYLLVPFF